MNIQRLYTTQGTPVSGPLLITPTVLSDDRGFFLESWNQRGFIDALEADGQVVPNFVQDNHSRSRRSVLRGLHYQIPPHPQGKLVRCVFGEIFDVAVDIRRSSPTFGHWVGATLSAVNHQQLWVPEGFAHGFLTISENADVLYKTTDFWYRDCEQSLCWNDPQLAIAWPALGGSPGAIQPLLSEKDAVAPLLMNQPCVF